MRTVTPEERRRRLARRHGLVEGHRATGTVDAARRVVGLHATDPSTIVLSARARVDGLQVADVERALYEDRAVVKHLAMRRTLFVFPTDLLPEVQAGASDRVADRERRRLAAEVEKAGLHPDGTAWLTAAAAAVLDDLADGRTASSTELRDRIPLLVGATVQGEGRSWGGANPIGPRVLTTLSAAGEIVRATNAGAWYVSRPLWARTDRWLGAPIERLAADDGHDRLVAHWLRAFGPGTDADVKWWIGSTLTAVRRSFADLGTVQVDLGDGTVGHLLPDDAEPEPEVDDWVALLPGLDPTTMGWTGRDWYLGGHRSELFDTAGNAGPTMWWNGRIVGGWRQDDDGRVITQLLEDVPRPVRSALDRQAADLGEWLDGRRVMLRFPSPLWKRS